MIGWMYIGRSGQWGEPTSKQMEYQDKVLYALHLIAERLETIKQQNNHIIAVMETISEVNADAHGYKLRAYNPWSS